jgi:hypothetical protein
MFFALGAVLGRKQTNGERETCGEVTTDSRGPETKRTEEPRQAAKHDGNMGERRKGGLRAGAKRDGKKTHGNKKTVGAKHNSNIEKRTKRSPEEPKQAA